MLLAVISTFYACWMPLAWLSDLMKPAAEQGENGWYFFSVGLLVILLNFLMAALLLLSIRNTTNQKEMEILIM